MTDKPILYVRAGRSPANWRELEVRLASNGQVVKDVIEANAYDGWYVQAVRRADGRVELNPRSGTMVTRRVRRKIKIAVRQP